MLSVRYELQGGEVPAHLKGAVITIRQAETYPEAESLCENGQAGVVAKFHDGYVIADQSMLRRLSAKEGATVESLQAASDAFKLGERKPGTPKTSKPETVAKNTAANAGNANFERLEKEGLDSTWAKRGIQFGFLDLDAYNVWKAARDEAKAAKANGTPAAETVAK